MIRRGVLAAADGALLVGLWPTARGAPGMLGRLDGTIAERGSDAALGSLAAGAIWLLAAWLAIGLLATGAAAMPGRCGRLARRLADRLLPRTVQRIIAGSAGLGVLLAPVSAVAGPSTPPSPAPATVSTAAVPTPGWPLDEPAARAQHARPAAPPPELPRPVPHAPAEPERITVRPGDSLWLIAARRIGPAAGPSRIAAEWPRWYAANRALIGPDPGLIRPGQVLQAPDAPTGGAP